MKLMLLMLLTQCLCLFPFPMPVPVTNAIAYSRTGSQCRSRSQCHCPFPFPMSVLPTENQILHTTQWTSTQPSGIRHYVRVKAHSYPAQVSGFRFRFSRFSVFGFRYPASCFPFFSGFRFSVFGYRCYIPVSFLFYKVTVCDFAGNPVVK